MGDRLMGDIILAIVVYIFVFAYQIVINFFKFFYNLYANNKNNALNNQISILEERENNLLNELKKFN